MHTTLLAALLLALPGDWSLPRGNVDHTGTTDAVGALDGVDDGRPGIAARLPPARSDFSANLFVDLDGDGVDELLGAGRGRVFAWNLADGSLRWASADRSLDSIVGLADLDGDGVRAELIVSGLPTGGGVLVLDVQSGGVLGSVGTLPDFAGVEPNEVAIADLDGDGADELVYAPRPYRTPMLYVARFDAAFQVAGTVTLEYEGYANLTPVRAGPLLPGGEPAVFVNRGEFDAWAPCEAAAVEAICDDGDGSFCLCHLGNVGELTPALGIFGARRQLDLDGDGQDEVVELSSNPTYGSVVSVWDLQAPVTVESSLAWGRVYMEPGQPGALMAPQQLPPVLGGEQQVVVAVANNGAGDLDPLGQPFEDGVELLGDVGTLGLSAADGSVRWSLPGQAVHGWTDLDGDGAIEVVTSPVTGWVYGTGVTGWTIACELDGCTATEAWSHPDFRLVRSLASLDGRALPGGALHVLPDGGDGPALAGFVGDDLALLGFDGGAAVRAQVALAEGDEVLLRGGSFPRIPVATSAGLLLFDAALAADPQPIEVERGAHPALVVRPEDGALPLVIAGERTWRMEADGPAPVAAPLLPRVSLAHDFDGDGLTEFVSYGTRADVDAAGAQIRVDAYDPATGAWSPRWDYTSEDHPILGGADPWTRAHWTVGEFDGEAGDDLAVQFTTFSQHWVVFLRGSDGAELAVVPTLAFGTGFSRLFAVDVRDAAGEPGTDGVDEVVVPEPGRIELVSAADGVSLQNWVRGAATNIGVVLERTPGDSVLLLEGLHQPISGNDLRLNRYPADVPEVWGPVDLPTPSGYPTAVVLETPGLGLLAYGAGGGQLVFVELDGGAQLQELWLHEGAVATAQPDPPESLGAVIGMDVDGDGDQDLVAGSRAGWVYGLAVPDLINPTTTVLWSIQIGASVVDLAAADVDGDGAAEVLASGADGHLYVLDGLGVELDVTRPSPGVCVEFTEVLVSGTAANVDTIDLSAQGNPGSEGIDASSGTWSGTVQLEGLGLQTIRVEGFDADGNLLVVREFEVVLGADEDGDGVTVCGEDCDDTDPDRAPGLEEICDDGIDQDCDGQDVACPEPTPTPTPAPPGDDDDAGEGCACNASVAGPGASLLLLLVPGRRRRR